ncbi:MAG: DUF4136 domain-containing protein [Acidiferrobacterales bacterium]|nr:DUF4136 domain-containing protein [Acidiferrobacterales bacterium]
MQLLRGSLAVFLVLAPAMGLAKLKISSSHNPSAPFASMKTYAWGLHEMQDPATASFDEEFVQARVLEAVNRGLASKGFQEQSDKPDFRIHWSALVGTKLAVTRGERTRGLALGGFQPSVAMGPPPRAQVQDVDVGTLILTFVDTRTEKVVWRGFAQEAFNFNWSDEKKSARIQRAVRKLLDLFPPPPAETGHPGFDGN